MHLLKEAQYRGVTTTDLVYIYKQNMHEENRGDTFQ